MSGTFLVICDQWHGYPILSLNFGGKHGSLIVFTRPFSCPEIYYLACLFTVATWLYTIYSILNIPFLEPSLFYYLHIIKKNANAHDYPVPALVRACSWIGSVLPCMCMYISLIAGSMHKWIWVARWWFFWSDAENCTDNFWAIR